MIDVKVVLEGVSDIQIKNIDHELRKKSILFSQIYDRIKRRVEYTLSFKTEGQKYLLPTAFKKKLGMTR